MFELREIDGSYDKVFNYLVERTEDYIVSSGLKCMVLGVSGGIDSTLVALIANQVYLRSGIPLIGRSLRMKNKQDEFDASKLVGEAFCTDFDAMNLGSEYSKVSSGFKILEENHYKKINDERDEYTTPIAEGNIMARLRMMYLYHLAGVNKGLVLDTDNLTEHNLGFWTIHGDEGDFNPIGGLWKTEVYALVGWYLGAAEENEVEPLCSSLHLVPTDGNGISSSDLEQIGGKDYYEVDKILRPIVAKGEKAIQDLINLGYDPEVVQKIYTRHKNSEFKRKTSRTIKITREEIFEFLDN